MNLAVAIEITRVYPLPGVRERATERTIDAGGPGSGCRGPNCGRPGTGNSIDVREIPRSEYKLTPRQRAVETRFRKQIAANPAKAMRAYRKLHGKELNADLAKELSPDYAKDRTSFAVAVHDPASWLVSQMYARELATSRPGLRNEVFFTAGGGGVGKSSTVKSDTALNSKLKQSQIVYDGTLRPFDKADAKIQQALKAKKDAMVLFTHREYTAAFQGTLDRAMRPDKTGRPYGRVVPMSEFVKQHTTVLQSMKALVAKYKNNPRFHFAAVDNSGGLGAQKRTTLDAIPEPLKAAVMYRKLRSVLNENLKRGKITAKVYRAVLQESGSKQIGS